MTAYDIEARALLEDFRKLDGALKREMTLPAVNWDRLAERLSDAVAEEDERARRVYRIGAWWGRVAIAAMVLIAIGSIVLFHFPRPGAKVEEVATNSTPAPA